MPGMCGRITQITNASQVAVEFSITKLHFDPVRAVPRYNVAPTQPVMVITSDLSGQRHLSLMQWGLIPAWAKDLSKLPTLINARLETIAEKPSFRGAFRHRRCLVPTDGFYEWKRDGKDKQPFFIHRPDGHALAIAGLREQWESPDGGLVETFCLITRDADQGMLQVHNRMPVMLNPSDYDAWLDPKQQGKDVLPRLHPVGSDQLAFTAVSKRVNSTANDDPSLLTPV